MGSTVVDRLRQQAKAAALGPQRVVAMADLAAALARTGEGDEAQRLIEDASQLAQDAGVAADADCACALALARALAAYFSRRHADCEQALHILLNLAGHHARPDWEAMTRGWLSTTCFVRSAVVPAVEHAVAGLALHSAGGPRQAEAQARLRLSVANLFAWCDLTHAATPWYLAAHRLARAADDDIMTEAVLHKLALVQAEEVTDLFLDGRQDTARWREALAGLQSSQGLMQQLGVTALDAVMPLTRANLLMAAGDFAGARALYDAQLDRARDQQLHSHHAEALACRAVCSAELGRPDAARADIAEAGALWAGLGPGGRAGLARGLARAARALQDEALRAHWAQQFTLAHAEVDGLHERLRHALAAHVPPVPVD
jgi:hypothetical protein